MDLTLPSDREYNKRASQEDFYNSLSIVFTRPSKTCDVKNLTFLRISIFQSASRTNLLTGEGFNDNQKKDLQEKTSRGLELQTRTSLLHNLRLNSLVIKDPKGVLWPEQKKKDNNNVINKPQMRQSHRLQTILNDLIISLSTLFKMSLLKRRQQVRTKREKKGPPILAPKRVFG